MPSLSGTLVDVTSAPSDATEVWIRAADGRVSGANVVLEETRRVPVTGGKFTVTVLPGRAHLVVIHAGMSQEHVPLLVQDGMTTIAEAVRLGSEDWEDYSPSQAEQIKAEIAAEVAKAATSAQAAKTAQQAAEQARTDTQNALSTKADKVHTHALADVTGLDTALAGKASQADVVALQARLAGIIPYAVMMAGPEEGQNPIIIAGKAHQRGTNARIAIPKGLSQVQLTTAFRGATTLVLADGDRKIDVKWWPSDPGGINMVEAVGNDAYIYLRAATATQNDTFSLVIIPMSDQN